MKIKESILANKITLITDELTSVESVTIHIAFGVGSRNEKKSENGISHFLEHMAFKGTKTKNAKQIADAFEELGGYFNAFTSKDRTMYFCKFLKDDVEKAFKLLSDIVINSEFADVEADKERNVILQELANSIDTPDDIIHDYFAELALPNQSLGRTILGLKENIESINQNSLNKYYSTHYNGGNMYIAISGNITHEDMVIKANKYFKDVKIGKVDKAVKANYQGGEKHYERDIEQIQLMVGYESFSRKDENFYAVQLYNFILGEGMSSKLFQEIREKHGLAYSIYSFNSSYEDMGLFAVHIGTKPENRMKSLRLIKEVMEKTADKITQKELDKAVKSLKINLLMNLENTASRSRRLASSFINHNKFVSNEELLKKFQLVKPKDVKYICEKILSSKETIVSLGKN